MRQLTDGAPGFRHYRREGREMVAIPKKIVVSEIDITRLMDPRDIKRVLEYRMAEAMGQVGFSTKAIAATLGLSPSAAAYRLHRAEVKIKDYRNGNSPLARHAIKRLGEVVQRRVIMNLSGAFLK